MANTHETTHEPMALLVCDHCPGHGVAARLCRDRGVGVECDRAGELIHYHSILSASGVAVGNTGRSWPDYQED